MGHLGNHEHSYQSCRFLPPWKMLKLIYRLQNSDTFEVGDLMHIYLRGTDICVGYLGDDTAELVDTDRNDVRSMRNKLRRYYYSV